jgi:hypothetical protein
MKERTRTHKQSSDASGIRKARPGHAEWVILASDRPPEGAPRSWTVCCQCETKIAAISLGGYLFHSGKVDAFAVVNLRTLLLECVFPLVTFPGKIRYGQVDMSQFERKDNGQH